jgi:hypothetical protein
MEFEGQSNMASNSFWQKVPVQIGFGIIAGAANIYIDNFGSKGEVSPIVTTFILFTETTTSGIIWKKNGWIASTIAWVSLPMAHIIKHLYNLPDTLHPNTYASILYLSGFTLLVGAVGTGLGYLISSIKVNK